MYLHINSFGVYYFRVAVPSRLRKTLGRKELKQSLRTKNRHHAERMARLYALRAFSTFERLQVNDEEVDHDNMAKKNLPFLNMPEFKIDKIDIRNGVITGIETDGTKEDAQKVEELILSISEQHQKLSADESEATKKLAALFNDLQKRSSTMPSREELESYLAGIITQPDDSSSASSTVPASWTLRELFDRFIEYKKNLNDPSKRWSANTAADREGVCNALSRLLGGDTLISQFTKDDASNLLSTLRVLPSNISKPLKNTDLTIQKIIEKNKGKTLSDRTIKKYWDLIRGSFDFAVNQKQIKLNAFKLNDENDKFFVDEKKSDHNSKKPFSKNNLDSLLNSSHFMNLKHDRKNSYLYWITLFGLYTGARLGEIIQLTIDDVKCIKGTYLIDINEQGQDKHVKNAPSIRRVPLHDDLISRYGFLDYLNLRLKNKKRGMKFLFDAPIYENPKTNKPDWSKRSSINFGRLLKTLNIKEQGLSFHSFRGTFATVLLRSGVERELVKSILGHQKKADTLGKFYDFGFSFNSVKMAVDKFSQDALDSIENVSEEKVLNDLANLKKEGFLS